MSVSLSRDVKMPLYEYKCQQCKTVLEALQKVSDPPLKNCPKCSGPLAKLLSPPSIQFRGSGFYITDYARNKHSGKEINPEKKSKEEKKGAPLDTESSSSSKSDK